VKVGDKIRIVNLPGGLVDDAQLQTKSFFELCLGQVFPLVGIVHVIETGGALLELQVGEVVGQKAFMHSSWIETELVELVEGSS
jgi:hypothetical protein